MRPLSVAAVLLAFCAPLGAESLPEYKPQMHVTGVLRSCGTHEMGALLKLWQAGFKRQHLDVVFADDLKSSASGMYGLDMRTADVALMGRPIFPYERYGVYERSWVYPAFVEVATGSAERLPKSPAHAIFVHKDNPLAKISMREPDRVLGAHRAGRWPALTCVATIART